MCWIDNSGMLNPNLLSPQDKNNTRFEEWWRLSIFILVAAFIIFLAFTVLLAPLYFSARRAKNLFTVKIRQAEGSGRLPGIKAIEAEVAVLNQLFKKMIQNGAPDQQISFLIDRLLLDGNNRISISSISYRKGKEFSITGFAPTRRDLIAFEKKLQEDESLKDVSSPISNLVKEANINFSIRAVPTF